MSSTFNFCLVCVLGLYVFSIVLKMEFGKVQFWSPKVTFECFQNLRILILPISSTRTFELIVVQVLTTSLQRIYTCVLYFKKRKWYSQFNLDSRYHINVGLKIKKSHPFSSDLIPQNVFPESCGFVFSAQFKDCTTSLRCLRRRKETM